MKGFHHAYSELNFSPQKKSEQFNKKQMSLSDIFPKEKAAKLSLDNINTTIDPKNKAIIVDMK